LLKSLEQLKNLQHRNISKMNDQNQSNQQLLGGGQQSNNQKNLLLVQ